MENLVQGSGFTKVERRRRLPRLTQAGGHRPCQPAGWGAVGRGGHAGLVNWGSQSRCCEAIGLHPHPPFIVSCCREVSLVRGQAVRGGGKCLGGARPLAKSFGLPCGPLGRQWSGLPRSGCGPGLSDRSGVGSPSPKGSVLQGQALESCPPLPCAGGRGRGC